MWAQQQCVQCRARLALLGSSPNYRTTARWVNARGCRRKLRARSVPGAQQFLARKAAARQRQPRARVHACAMCSCSCCWPPALRPSSPLRRFCAAAPGLTDVTPSPTLSTTPAASWPRMHGNRPGGQAREVLVYWIARMDVERKIGGKGGHGRYPCLLLGRWTAPCTERCVPMQLRGNRKINPISRFTPCEVCACWHV